jgi:hypothetical protein
MINHHKRDCVRAKAVIGERTPDRGLASSLLGCSNTLQAKVLAQFLAHLAGVNPRHRSGSDNENDDRGRGTHRGLGMDILGGIDRNPSPRKGRSRTGTMIFSEALIMAEEVGKGGGSPGSESLGRALIPRFV